MPNWVETRVKITGPVEDIKAWARASYQGYTIPRGSELAAKSRHVTLLPEGPEGVGQFTFGALTGVPKDFADNWYDRGIELWGTKWDISPSNVNGGVADLLLDALDLPDAPLGETLITDFSFTMSTAWSPALPYLEAVVEKFPLLSIQTVYLDEGDCFAGYAYIHRYGSTGEDFVVDDIVPHVPYPEGDDPYGFLFDAWADANAERESKIFDALWEQAANV
jgi:hypothetical protein